MTRIIRDTSVGAAGRAQDKLYSPCDCGSGKKFKFCCRDKSPEDRKAAKLYKFKTQEGKNA